MHRVYLSQTRATTVPCVATRVMRLTRRVSANTCHSTVQKAATNTAVAAKPLDAACKTKVILTADGTPLELMLVEETPHAPILN